MQLSYTQADHNFVDYNRIRTKLSSMLYVVIYVIPPYASQINTLANEINVLTNEINALTNNFITKITKKY